MLLAAVVDRKVRAMDVSAVYQQRRTGTPVYRIRMIGRFEFEPAGVLPAGRKACALIAYLAYVQQPVARSRIAALLWSERAEPQALASVRQCLIELKALARCNPPLLYADRNKISLDNSLIISDLEELAALSAIGDAAGVASLLPSVGDCLLGGFDGIDPVYDEWLSIVRTHCQDMVERLAVTCAEMALEAGDHEEVRKLAGRLAEFDPVNEAAARLEMSTAALAGDRDAVRRAWKRIEAALYTELGVRPFEETCDHYRQLVSASLVPAAAKKPVGIQAALPDRAAVPAPWYRRIGRLKLVLAGGALLVAALAAGMAPRLAKAPAVTVQFVPVVTVGKDEAADAAFARQLLSSFKQLSPTLGHGVRIVERNEERFASTGADLHVRTLLNRGASGSNALIQLVATRNNEVLWSAEFTNSANDLSNLGLNAAGGLSAVLRCAFKSLPAPNPLGDAEKLQLAMAACAVMTGTGPQSNVPAQALAREIVMRKPQLPVGLTLMAWAQLDRLWTEAPDLKADQIEVIKKRAREYADKAIRLDPSNGVAYVLLADATDPFQLPSLLEERLRILEAGLRSSPDNSDLLCAYGLTRFVGGYNASGVASVRRAVAIDPTSPFKAGLLVRRLMSAGHVEEAFVAQQRSEKINPDDGYVVEQRLRMMVEAGDPHKALALYDRQARKLGYPPRIPSLSLDVLNWRADPSSLDLAKMEREARAEIAREPDSSYFVAVAFARVGAVDRAFRHLESASIRDGKYAQYSILFWPDAAEIRRDPRFFKLMDRIGLVDHWVRHDEWPDFCSEPGLHYDCRKEAVKLGKVLKRG